MSSEALNPGSFNSFREKLDPDIPTHEAVKLYTGALAAFREAVTADPQPVHSVADFMPRRDVGLEVMGNGQFEPLVAVHTGSDNRTI